MVDSSSPISVDTRQTVRTSDRLADTGHAAVDAAFRFAIAQAGAEAARQANTLDAEAVLTGAVEAIAHLCDRFRLCADDVFASALQAKADAERNDPPATPFDLARSAAIIRWKDVPTPAPSSAAHARTILTLLHDQPDGVTSSELRDLGIKNPSNVVMTLIRAGSPIERIPLTRGGRKGREALYRLDRASA